MGKSAPIKDGWTLGHMVDTMLPDHDVMVLCTACGRERYLDRVALEALAERVGRSYSLMNRRCRCRLTRGCAGWNRFWWRSPRATPMWTADRVWE